MFLRIFINGLLAALVATGSLRAQDGASTAPQTGQVQISGILVDSKTAQPIAHARVAVAPVTRRDDYTTMITGSDGAFVFTGLNAGKYTLTAQARGYLVRSFNQHEQFASSIAVGPDLDSTQLLFQLPPECGISGVVSDEAGEPVRNAQVVLYLTSRGNSAGDAMRISGATTNDEGAYRFRHLRSGRYLLAVDARPWYAQHWRRVPVASAQESATIRQLDVAYPVTFNGSVTDAREATPIVLRDGDKAIADIGLHPVPALHVPLNAEIGVSDPKVQVVLERDVLDGLPMQSGIGVQNSIKGEREIVGIAPGRYRLRMWTGSASESVSKEIEISANGAIENHADADVAVSAEVQSGSASTGSANLRLVDKNQKEVLSGNVGSDGKVAFPRGIPPGRYEITLSSASGIYVKSIAATGASVNGRTISVRRGAPVKLTVGAALGEGTVSGVALLESKPHGGSMIVLVPADPAHNHVLFRRDQSNTDGSFILPNVVPGAYTVIAVEDWEIDWMNPDVLKRYLGRGTTVQVQLNGKYEVKAVVQ